MMETANIVSQVRQFQQFDIATSNFKQKFGGLPGDNSVFTLGSGAGRGNNNGIIEDGPCCGNLVHNGNEFTNFWYQLTNTGMLQNPVIYGIPDNPTPKFTVEVNMPSTKIDKTVGILANGNITLGKNYYTLITNMPPGGGVLNTFALSPWTSLKLDTKMDDGASSTGKVFARPGGNFTTTGVVGAWCASGGQYYIASASAYSRVCEINVEMFSQAGDPQ